MVTPVTGKMDERLGVRERFLMMAKKFFGYGQNGCFIIEQGRTRHITHFDGNFWTVLVWNVSLEFV